MEIRQVRTRCPPVPRAGSRPAPLKLLMPSQGMLPISPVSFPEEGSLLPTPKSTYNTVKSIPNYFS